MDDKPVQAGRGDAREPRGRAAAATARRARPPLPEHVGFARRPIEPGETPEQAAPRELMEEASLRPDQPLRLFLVQPVPEHHRVKHYFYGLTSAVQDDVVLGEGAAMVFTSVDQVFEGRGVHAGHGTGDRRFPGLPRVRRAAGPGMIANRFLYLVRHGEATADGG